MTTTYAQPVGPTGLTTDGFFPDNVVPIGTVASIQTEPGLLRRVRRVLIPEPLRAAVPTRNAPREAWELLSQPGRLFFACDGFRLESMPEGQLTLPLWVPGLTPYPRTTY